MPLTTEQIDALEAGPELDHLVAWNCGWCPPGTDLTNPYEPPFHPSINFEQALDAARNTSWRELSEDDRFTLHLQPDGRWMAGRVRYHDADNGGPAWFDASHDQSAAVAICRAILKAVQR